MVVAQLLLSAAAGALPLLGLWLMKLLVDAVAGAETAQDPEGSFQEVILLVAAAGTVALAGTGVRLWSVVAAEAQGQAVHDHVHRLLHDKAVELDLQDMEDPGTLDLLQRARQEAPVRPQRLVSGLSQVGQGGLSLILMAGLLATLHWAVSVLVVAAAVPGLLIRVRHARRLHRWQERRAHDQRETAYFGWLQTAPTAAREVRLFGLGASFRQRYEALRGLLRGERLELAGRRARGELAGQVLGLVVTFSAYAYVGWRVIHGLSTIGDLVMYAQAIQRGQAAVQTLFTGVTGVLEDRLFLDGFFRFLALPSRLPVPARPRAVPATLKSGLALENVGFRYPSGGPPVLHGVDAVLRPGERVALVGANGAGKSTLVKLLCRFYDPTEGRITLDGAPLEEHDPLELRRNISAVFQDFVRYELTVADNIRLGASGGPPVTDEEMREAARRSGLHDRVESLPEGYETRLGRRFDGGRELSIGEWQKLALARAWLRQAPILLLDEPASSLDARAEDELVRNLLALSADRVSLVVTHRLSTARRCDRVWMLDGGRLVEQGSHEDLVARRGPYASLYEAWSRHVSG